MCLHVLETKYQLCLHAQVDWPPELTRIMEDLGGIVQINLVQLPKLSCLWVGIDFKTTLVFTTVGPLVVAVLLAIPLCVCKLKALCFGWTDASREIFEALQDQFFANLLFMCFLIYPICSLTSLQVTILGAPFVLVFPSKRTLSVPVFFYFYQAFDCHESLRVLRVDMRTECQGLFSWLGLYSLVCFFVYPLGLPLVFWYILKFQGVPQMAQRKRVNRAFTNLLALFNKSIGTNEAKLLAQLIGRVESDEDELERRIEQIYARLCLFETDNTHVGNETEKLLYKCFCEHFQLEANQRLDEVMSITLMRRVVANSMAFTGMETIENVTKKQGSMLLSHEWPTAGKAIGSRAAMKKAMIKA